MSSKWNPTEAQRELFKEWREFTIQTLTACIRGYPPKNICDALDERVGEEIPLKKMGLPSFSHFLFQMRDDIFIKKVKGKNYVFLKETSIPPELQHIRKQVRNQTVSDSKYPPKEAGIFVPVSELLLERNLVSVPNPSIAVNKNRANGTRTGTAKRNRKTNARGKTKGPVPVPRPPSAAVHVAGRTSKTTPSWPVAARVAGPSTSISKPRTVTAKNVTCQNPPSALFRNAMRNLQASNQCKKSGELKSAEVNAKPAVRESEMFTNRVLAQSGPQDTGSNPPKQAKSVLLGNGVSGKKAPSSGPQITAGTANLPNQIKSALLSNGVSGKKAPSSGPQITAGTTNLPNQAKSALPGNGVSGKKAPSSGPQITAGTTNLPNQAKSALLDNEIFKKRDALTVDTINRALDNPVQFDTHVVAGPSKSAETNILRDENYGRNVEAGTVIKAGIPGRNAVPSTKVADNGPVLRTSMWTDEQLKHNNVLKELTSNTRPGPPGFGRSRSHFRMQSTYRENHAQTTQLRPTSTPKITSPNVGTLIREIETPLRVQTEPKIVKPEDTVDSKSVSANNTILSQQFQKPREDKETLLNEIPLFYSLDCVLLEDPKQVEIEPVIRLFSSTTISTKSPPFISDERSYHYQALKSFLSDI